MSRPPQTGNLFKNPYPTPNGNNDTNSSTNGNGNQANGAINEQGWHANGQHGNGQALPSAQPPQGAQQGPMYQGQPNASTNFASGMFTNAHQNPAMPPSPPLSQPMPPWVPQQQQSVPPSGPLNAGPPSGIRQSGNAWPMSGPQGPGP